MGIDREWLQTENKFKKNLFSVEFQVFSQNIGHEDPWTTFEYYSNLVGNDIRDVILKGVK